MSAREYAPGTVAVATVNGVRNVHMMRGTTYWWAVADNRNGGRLLDSDDVTEVRPLVVLDPEDVNALKEFVQRTQIGTPGTFITPLVEKVQHALRSYVTPPKPAEPTGLGAVVEDAEGVLWVKTHHHWRNEYLIGISWDDLNAVRELSAGWSA